MVGLQVAPLFGNYGIGDIFRIYLQATKIIQEIIRLFLYHFLV